MTTHHAPPTTVLAAADVSDLSSYRSVHGAIRVSNDRLVGALGGTSIWSQRRTAAFRRWVDSYSAEPANASSLRRRTLLSSPRQAGPFLCRIRAGHRRRPPSARRTDRRPRCSTRDHTGSRGPCRRRGTSQSHGGTPRLRRHGRTAHVRASLHRGGYSVLDAEAVCDVRSSKQACANPCSPCRGGWLARIPWRVYVNSPRDPSR